MHEPSSISYLGIMVALILTGMGLPVPEEVFVIVAGVATSKGALEFGPALAACLVGAIVGDCAMYAIGYHFGRGLLKDRPWFTRFLTPQRERRMEHLIHRHGLKVFLLARFMVGVRSPVYVTAGILRVPFRRFIVVDIFCAILVVSTFFGLSYWFAEYMPDLWGRIRQAEVALTLLAAAAVTGIAAFFYLRRRRRWARVRRRRQRRQQADSARAVEETRSTV